MENNMLYNMPYIKENYKDFIQFVLSQPPSRHVGVGSWLKSEVGDWIKARDLEELYIFDGYGQPVGVFGRIGVEGGEHFPSSDYGSQSMGGWCDITIELDRHNYLCYGHLQQYIRDTGQKVMKPYI